MRERSERGDARFYVVVPMTAVEHETTAVSLGFSMGGEMLAYPSREVLEQDAQRREARIEASRARAEVRLARMLERVQKVDADVEGEIGDPDPLLAIKDVLKDRWFDEILLSTLPARLSRWLKMDLPSRVSRTTPIPVTTIEAEEHSWQDEPPPDWL